MHEQFTVTSSHRILKNHRAYGQPLLPGLAYIDMLYQIFREHGHDYTHLELRNLSIYHPLAVGDDFSVRLEIRCSETAAGQWQIRVDGQEQRNGFLALDKKRYITAEMHRTGPVVFTETLDLEQVKQAAQPGVDLDDLYREYRRQDLVHTGFMKADGTFFPGDSAAVIDISLGQAALDTAADFMFHPTLIDCSSLGAGTLFSLLLKEEKRLFLPLYYESFRAAALLQHHCITRIQTALLGRKKDLLYMTLEFFNEAGKKVGELKNLTNKLVREERSINPDRGNTSQPVGAAQSVPLSVAPPRTPVIETKAAGTGSSAGAEDFLRQLLAERLKKPANQIDTQLGYYEMGLDSPGLLETVQAIEVKIKTPLSPTLLFEYTTIAELAAYLTENHASHFNPSPAASQEVKSIKRFSGGSRGAVFSKSAPLVAIIGMAGRYPGARNPREFWQNLVEGKDCIGKIPPSRWDWRQLDGLPLPAGTRVSGWGGFIDDPDCFDPQFFRISPREAEMIDPQERLFLEVCWEAVEDAGYTPKTLVPPRGRNRRRPVGVFVGVMHKDYTLVGAEVLARGQAYPLSLSCGPIANRVSYFCNFHGPSMAVDTLCSSSLTALHLALESISLGESEVALAGGVNLSLHPGKYISYGLGNMHSSDGYCHTFGKGGDGFVSGEGIGAVLLKPLANALRDRDHIYAVIKGSTINHGGTVSGLTVPSPVAQADMIEACLEKTGIHPRTISYVEAHGTGTSLGDPIEIQGLVKAYRRYTPDRQYCSIGSVKSNIGHAESAAGISGLSKAALQLYYQTLVPSLHAEELNPYIDFPNSPFYVQQKTGEWKPPVIKENGREVRYPRRAGLSSFGAAGANAHIILEEFLPREAPRQTPGDPAAAAAPVIVPLSARDKERLRAYARELLEFLGKLPSTKTEKTPVRHREEHKTADREILETKLREILAGIIQVKEEAVDVEQEWFEYGLDPVDLTRFKEKILEQFSIEIDLNALNRESSIASVAAYLLKVHPEAPGTGPTHGEIAAADLAYTLQVGREAMEERVAFIVQGIPGLVQKLDVFLKDKEDIPQCYRGRVKQYKEAISLFSGEEEIGEFLRKWIGRGRLDKVAELWARGVEVDWDLLYGETGAYRPRRISLPTYPFARERCWVPGTDSPLTGIVDVARGSGPTPGLSSGAVMLVPVWDSIPVEKDRVFPSPTGRLVIVGGTGERREEIGQFYPQARQLELQPGATPGAIARQLEAHGSGGPIDHILWIAPHHPLASPLDEGLLEEQQEGVLLGFRLIKALLGLGYGTRDLGWSVITIQTQGICKDDGGNLKTNPAHAGIHGLIGTMAKEYPNWKVRLMDLEADSAWPLAEIFTLPADPQGDTRGYRGQEWYRQKWIPLQRPGLDRTLYRTGGVYVVIGGAGGIGAVWSEYMIRTYQARLIWIGRREKDAAVQAKAEALAALGPAPHYIAADASQREALEKAYEEIKQRYSQVHGVIHSAVGPLDQSLANMEEDLFRAGLSAKVAVGVRMAQVFQKEPLDFILFFSSIGAFARAHGQSSYSAGCAFKDALAQHLARAQSPLVKVMNWGYWGDIGVGRIVPGAYKSRLQQTGIGAIAPGEAMAALETLLAGPLTQMALIKTTTPQALERMNPGEGIEVYPEQIPNVGQHLCEPIRKSGAGPQLQSLPPGIKGEMKRMEALLCKLLWSQLQSMGLFTAKKTAAGNLQGGEPPGLPGFYRRWLEECTAVLLRHHYLQRDGESYTAVEPAPGDPDAVWREWDLEKTRWLEDPGKRAQVVLVETTLRALPQILTGKRSATDVIFPNSSLELVEGIFKHNPVADYFNDVLADTAIAYIRERLRQDSSAVLRIFEIGAGTGGTSAALFKKLEPHRQQIQEYCYTDISKAFLMYAEKEYGPGHPYLTYRIFNVEEPIAGQGIPAGGYDIVIAANVLHATRNLRQTVRNVKAILQKNGLLLLNELKENSLLAFLTFGLLEGWWLYEDPVLRIPGCPGLSPGTWQAVLAGEGFGPVFFPAREAEDFAQQVVAAVSDGIVRQKQSLEPGTPPREKKPGPPASLPGEATPARLREKSTEYFKKLLGETLKIPSHQIDPSEPFVNYGIDSILASQVNNALSNVFANIGSTLLFEYQTIDALVEHFIKTQTDSLRQVVGLTNPGPGETMATANRVTVEPTAPGPSSRVEKTGSPSSSPSRGPVAIIGMSARFPGARTPAEYWENLEAGKASIGEIPPDRWDWREYYHQDPGQAAALGKSYSKWGGFLEEFDRFDPLFFNMSPREAESIDPQERLFLEECWKALEDAGYAPSGLSAQTRRRAGVFGGITKQGFNLYGLETHRHFPATSFSSLVNRVSYFLDFQGPSMPVDTMCSSSLAAIHEACEYLGRGGGELALAGGVNLYLHPSTYVGLSMLQILSHTAASPAFGKGGTGFVPGEGVGVVVLKPLPRALEDGDTIYALIRGTALNHDGKGSGYSIPNPLQQADVIRQALEQQDLDPRTISYIEAAANGSEMGDAIEMTALTNVFSQRRGAAGEYKIGSVKPNIGHCESASGMAQVIKVLLALKHKTLAPTLLTGEANPRISFAQLPFQVQQEVGEWKPVMVDGTAVPRRAGITAVGAGGVNAHVILEEYIPDSTVKNKTEPGSPRLFILSAKDPERLEAYVEQWLALLHKDPPAGLDLERIVYTLQKGREEMPCRLAVVTESREDLVHRLEQWQVQRETAENCYSGDLKNSKLLIPGGVTPVIQSGDLHQLARLWILGNSIPWDELYRGKKGPRAAGLPTYPFQRRKCWLKDNQSTDLESLAGVSTNLPPVVEQEDGNTNKAVELYTLGAQGKSPGFEEEYLTFCPFAERVPGFSMSGVFLYPETYPAQYQLMKAKQIEMRQVLFCREDFRQIHTLLDIGCGHGTDVIQIAARYPHIQAHGYTITRAQAELGRQRLEQRNLSSRVTIFHKDSAKDAFPGNYDLVIGIEVSFHIRDKQGLFHNIASSLNPGGRVLLMDYIANLRGPIADPKVEISIPTQQDWIDLLSKQRLVIEEIIDVSPQIANFLYDPRIEQHIADLPQVARDTLRNYANQSESLDKGWISYCLLKLERDSSSSEAECRDYNAGKISLKTPYPEALAEMQRRGHIPYPKDPKSGKASAAAEANPGNPGAPAIKEGLLEVFGTVLGLQGDEVEKLSTFNELGISSRNAVELLEAINRKFDLALPTSVVFEYNNPDSLAGYIARQLQESGSKPPSPGNPPAHPTAPGTLERTERIQAGSSAQTPAARDSSGIAVIGLSCRSAGAGDQEEFWNLIREGKVCLREIDNKSWLDFFQLNSAKRVPTRYGAMEDIEYFDPFFFRISPKEAAAMDVTQRILLEESYNALEDSGYTASRLREQPVGTFIGTMAITPLARDFSHFSLSGTDTSILASRIAYFLDLKGPALAINTACSSSLTAIDIACRQLAGRDIDMAIAGGISIYTHPGAFIALNNAGMLSPSGQCRPFDHAADGIVVGDGVGVVILKRLADALRDKDFIYGIIRGSGTNQDGQTSGITVPSFLSQSRLEESIYRKYQIPVEDLQYLEAHGTATKLGDPIEVHALTLAFEKFTAKKRFCAMGSLKANIGHTGAAAGVMSVIKVLLSLKHRQIPPSISFNKENEHIDFANSPVVVNTTLKEWPVNSRGSRLAAVSSFGFSGTNAHLVIEEYRDNSPAKARVHETAPGLLVLSAQSPEGLQRCAQKTGEFLRAHPDIDFDDLLYTFQAGREGMPYRLAVAASQPAELIRRLEQFTGGRGKEPGCIFTGQITKKEGLHIGDSEEGKEFIQTLARHRKVNQLAQLWVNGTPIDWAALDPGRAVKRLAGLPTYPFARERYPLPGMDSRAAVGTAGSPASAVSEVHLHPLLQQNTSNLREQRFSSTFTGREFFLADHVVKGQRLLPGVAYLEMARAAVDLAAGPLEENRPGIRLKEVVWIRPLAVGDQPVRVHTRLFPRDNGEIDFEIDSEPGTAEAGPVVHCRGSALTGSGGESTLPPAQAAAGQEVPTLDLPVLQAQCSLGSLSAAQCLEAFRSLGIEYGPGHQGIETVYLGPGQVLARLSLPSSLADTRDRFVLHPSLLDSAFQASIGLIMGPGEPMPPGSTAGFRTALPFALQELEILGHCPSTLWALVRYSDHSKAGDKVQKLDIDLCDPQGRICVRMKEFSTRAADGELPAAETGGTLLLAPVWDPIPVEKGQPFPSPTDRLVIVGGTTDRSRALQQLYPKARILEIQPGDTPDTMAQKLEAHGSIDHILWITPDHAFESATDEVLLEEQDRGVLQGFRLIKALLGLGCGSRDLGWSVITRQTQSIGENQGGNLEVNPAHAGIHGLMGSLAREYPHWKIRLIDLEAGGDWPLADIFALAADPRGNARVYRGGQWYRQQLLPLHCPAADRKMYRTGGVYVVIGGAGGIGEAWSEYMIRTYQARLTWIGRRSKDEAIQAKLDRLATLGPAPHYIAADATVREALEKAYEEIKQRHPQVHGVIHSAIVLQDQSLANMEEERFKAGLAAKVEVSVRMAQVFQKESLDFVLFFSSLIAFTKNPGQANYASGCTFMDAFARRLSREWPCAVKVMNWGYWGSVGIVASDAYREKMARSGLGSIEPPEAMAALETLLASPLEQMAFLKTTRPLPGEDINPGEHITVYPGNPHDRTWNPQDQEGQPGQDAQLHELKSQQDLQTKTMAETLCRLLWGQLQSIGWFREENLVIADLETKTGTRESYRRWLRESIAILAARGYLHCDGQSCRVPDPDPIDTDALWKEWDRQKAPWWQNPQTKPQVVLLETALRALPGILTGKQPATAVLFPNSSLGLVEGIYRHNPVADYFNERVAHMVVAEMEERTRQDASARLRILEIGAGTGGTSAIVFDKIKPYRAHLEEYCYTDISKAFLMHAEKEYGRENPFLTYQIFDVEAPLAGQGIRAGGYDMVIAANVLHATRDIRETVRNAKAALKRHGLLLLNELSDKSLFAHLTFGLLPGWWRYRDPGLRLPGSPALAPRTWRQVLASEGFPAVRFPAAGAHTLGQQVVAAWSDGIVRQKKPDVTLPSFPGTGNRERGDNPKSPPGPRRPGNFPAGGIAPDLLREKSRAYLKKLVGKTLDIPAHKIDAAEPLEKYGIDSILVVQLTDTLREVFDNISSTIFFEYQTIDALTDHFLETRRDSLAALLGLEDRELDQGSPAAGKMLVEPSLQRPGSTPRPPARFLPLRHPGPGNPGTPPPRFQDTAIIGLAGRYPRANQVTEFWQNLKAGRNCITEVPRDRWDWREYFDEEKGKIGKIYSKWGGFMTDIDKFDPLFFQISPSEAERMDPQERLFLEVAYAGIEDAGYTPATLGESRKIGVFAGVMNGNYPTGANYSSIANRVSYVLNFQGPSLAVDTACSSSLTAIHLALESLRSGTSECAIAGGVNLIVAPIHYLKLSAMTMLSAGNQNKAFGNQADGFVDGEGVGVVVLKPLSRAAADGDHIYGIIKGSMLNTGGKTNGYTVPNPQAQAQLISAALQQAGVHARTISYVETHGTGTALGDPLEIAGLSKAFGQYTQDRQFCAIGSVKSNIGHCESAAGIAGVTKILLQLRHRQLVPSLHSRVPNPEIDFSLTPFVVQQELAEWQRPRAAINGEIAEYPRRAGISSFGAGGANAHLVIEEYIPPDPPPAPVIHTRGKPAIIVLSARNAERLREQVQQLSAALRAPGQPCPDTHLAAMAYTLQVGREAREERLAVMATSITELHGKLHDFLAGREDIENLYRGQVKPGGKNLAMFSADEDLAGTLAAWIGKGKYGKLLELWVNGLTFDWHRLYGDIKPGRISLPTYPFARERYWIAAGNAAAAPAAPAVLHPLLQQNTADLLQQRFSSVFTGREFFLSDHGVKGQRVLPGTASLEMARAAVANAAGALAQGRTGIRLKHVAWTRPVVVGDQPVQVHIRLFPTDSPYLEIAYEIYGEPAAVDGEPVVYSQGSAGMFPVVETPRLDLPALQARCSRASLSASQCYETFKALGIDYGPAHRGIERVYAGTAQVLAKLSLPSSISHTLDRFVLHPALLDSALQASIGLVIRDGKGTGPARHPALPFALHELEIFGACGAEMWALIRPADHSPARDNLQKLDIDLSDENGTVCVRMKGLSVRELAGSLEPDDEYYRHLLEKVATGELSEDQFQDLVTRGKREGNHG